ncbi:transmembrane protein 168 isoform X4 [Pantherophis guttatus]|uniref:Transmembrane protein 168 isoform X4 n=1 Tax=Pantherophis guttatus TaxID=94885 RepID=A0ABM3Z3Z4_PANGU|nr:transmembrane protein 168 isoform X4 [Pantherophis guttatus]
MKNLVKENYDKVTDKLSNAVSGLSEIIIKVDSKLEEFKSEVNVKIKDTDFKISDVDNKIQRVEDEITMMKFRSMEFAIRIRGIKESDRQDLRQICADALAVLLKINSDEIFYKIDKIYRVNSWVARQRQLPRDVVIYFTDRRMRNDILQKSFLSSVQVEGTEVGIYKELPPKMLKDRKDFGFLVKELNKLEIPFRWDAPTGIILKYQGERHQLNTVEKAVYFYYNVFKERSPSPRSSTVLEIKESEKEKQPQQELEVQLKQIELDPTEAQGAVGGFLEEPLLESSPILTTRDVALDLERMAEAKDQRITRAVSKQLKEKQLQERAMAQQYKKGTKSTTEQREAMGRAKSVASEDIRQSCSLLQKGMHDG